MEQERKRWPELVGKPKEEAVAKIKEDAPDFTIHVLPEGSPTTRDFCLSRVRVFVKEDGTVAEEPIAG